MNYTKGEWTATDLGEIRGEDNCLIALAYNLYTGEINNAVSCANAHLIAAAPEMYEALFIGLDLIKQKLYEHPDDKVAQAQKKVIDKVLAKAEGK